MLSHLILNDMIRVKGQIAWIVVLLEDPCERIQSLARVFFTEWGKRANNPVYNVLPECISSLLEMPQISFEQFQRLVRFLIHFVDKVGMMACWHVGKAAGPAGGEADSASPADDGRVQVAMSLLLSELSPGDEFDAEQVSAEQAVAEGRATQQRGEGEHVADRGEGSSGEGGEE